ncbi:MAG: zinc ABC transporter ATP-binding protein ZnuC [Geminicoccaceae bacterium]
MPADPLPQRWQAAASAAPLVRVERASYAAGRVEILHEVDLVIAPGELVTLIGPNGAGKTTLVRLVLGLIVPTRGRVLRRPDMRVGYVPQKLAIDPGLPITVRRLLSLARGSRRGDIGATLAEVGADHLIDRPVQSLSGGETQRVLLARALLRHPDLMVLDEPVRGVDVGGQVELYALIADLRRRHGCAVLLVSHDLHLVMAATDRVVCLNHHICCEGHPETVSAHPEYRALLGPAGAALAVYTHRHDHAHGLAGEVVGAPDPHGHGHDHGHQHHHEPWPHP